MTPIPYLFFHDTCEEAFTFYGKVFGTTPQFMRVKGSPMEEHLPPSAVNGIMHAHLVVGDGALNGSDDLSDTPGPAMAGCNVMIALPDEDRARACFDALSEGGEVRMPFAPQFWSPGFGAFTDRFGIRWMIDTAADPA
ncbi:PhnB protein [Loktanella fryxellensis]|uniref:PhnB protein n=1 Tax=Loktanella fryxellensis TaxID=245187 RepID=A0A1H8AW01_9RHOB|nr:VOC family protein [Loktanella fryxellensis]SEM75001.1 PhnB protein [Loktanella fryxellensis]